MSSPSSDIAAMIRLRPGMYIGDTDQRGVEHLIHELVANGLDQYLAGKATRILVSWHDGHSICVADNGEGLPFDVPASGGRTLAETYFTELHATPTADGHSPHVHLNASGVGLMVVSALSSVVEVASHRAGVCWEQRFEKGHTASPLRQTKSSERGTSITFIPDAEVMSAQAPRWPMVRRKLFDTAHLFPGMLLGLQEETFHAPGGLLDLAEFDSSEKDEVFTRPDQAAFKLNVELDDVQINAAACGTAKTCHWRSWCNGMPTIQHGTHVAGFKDALKSAGWIPATAMIHVLLKRPEFSAPTKSWLTTKHVRSVVRRAVLDQLKRDASAKNQSPTFHV
jgi:DNA gyrase subunit B